MALNENQPSQGRPCEFGASAYLFCGSRLGHASKPAEREAHIHHDRIVEKLEIARTMGLLTEFSVGASSPARRGEVSVTVWPSAHAADGKLKHHLAHLLDGLVAEPAIYLEVPAAAVAAMPKAAPQSGAVPASDGGASSSSSCFRRKTLLHGLATAGAMLTCVAVVLNVGPFANAPKIDRGPGPAASLASAVVAEPPLAARGYGGERVSSAASLTLPRERQAAAEPEPGQLNESFTAPQKADARTPAERSPAAAGPEDISEVTRTMMRLASFISVETAPWVAQPAPQKEAGVAAEGRPTAPDAGTPAQSAQPHRGQANVELAKDDPIAGVWAPNAGSCSARNFRDGALPTVMNTDGAWAGETFCMFTHQQPTENGWKVVAKCSNPRERWTSNVRLTVNGNRLTWTSRRGTQTYTRCSPDGLMAQAR
jgi:hypothetical protein